MTTRLQREKITEFFESEEARSIFAEYAMTLSERTKRPMKGKSLDWIREAIRQQGGPEVSKATVSRYWNQYQDKPRKAVPKLKTRQRVENRETKQENTTEGLAQSEDGSPPRDASALPAFCTNRCYHCLAFAALQNAATLQSILRPENQMVEPMEVAAHEAASENTGDAFNGQNSKKTVKSIVEELLKASAEVKSEPVEQHQENGREDRAEDKEDANETADESPTV